MTEEDYISYVCNRVKELRIHKGIKQVDLASEVGIDDSNLRRLENNRTSPTLKTLFRISHALQVDVADLLPNVKNQTNHSFDKSKSESKE
jgi:transcriptional regulator with XRE-family HTH domain